MKILALDTATERCSVALLTGEHVVERSTDTPRGHAELILPMVNEVLTEGGVQLTELDAIAYGRGPGAFTGVRIAIGVAQGLAFGAQRLTVGISNLAAVAQQVAQPGEDVLVCMDARMNEVYWGSFKRLPEAEVVRASSDEQVSAPAQVTVGAVVCAGTGFRAYSQLAHPAAVRVHADVLPRAADIARLATEEVRGGRAVSAAQAAPVYLRDKVAKKMTER